jgi:hypothetical protein
MADTTENKLAIKGERPLFPPAASDYLLRNYGISHTVATLATKRTRGDGPEFRKAGGAVLYSEPGLDRYAEAYLSAPVTSTSELPSEKRRRSPQPISP